MNTIAKLRATLDYVVKEASHMVAPNNFNVTNSLGIISMSLGGHWVRMT